MAAQATHPPTATAAAHRLPNAAAAHRPSESAPRPSAAALNRALFRWFATQRRDLAFRRTRDPYAVLVAEVMLQQTQTARVEPAWTEFMTRFPTVTSLAAASTADVIRAWAGLGYYGRAVRLHRAAKTIVELHAGRVPRDLIELEALPGVGAYTARAVAATAFGRRVAAVDTNVGRVVGRVFGVAPGPRSRAAIHRLADGWVPARRASDWTHAVMDLGATVCRARDPDCARCPLLTVCVSADSAGARVRPIARRDPRAPDDRFESTRRWLRGRIVARLSEEPDGAWVSFGDAIGSHPAESVEAAVAELVRDGVVERDGRGGARLAQAAA